MADTGDLGYRTIFTFRSGKLAYLSSLFEFRKTYDNSLIYFSRYIQ